MKKIVLTFGLISGAILSLMMFISCTLLNRDAIDFGKAEVIGYTTMIFSFLLVFFGIRSYRENVGGGTITFGRAVAVGILIVAISSICYVISWQYIYYNIAPDFMERMAAYQIEEMRAEGESADAIAEHQKWMEELGRLYRNPGINAAITFLEPLPVGLIMTLISAAILRRRNPPVAPAAPAAALVS